MPTPYDSRIVKLLKALADAVENWDGLEPKLAPDRMRKLSLAVSSVFPGPEPDKRIHALVAAGIYDAEDARLDPQPGDTFNDISQTFTVIARHEDFVVYQWETSNGKNTSGASVSQWSKWEGTFTPGSIT